MTYGEKAVGLDFNPSGDPAVGQLKHLYSRIIDQCDEARAVTEDSESKRLWSIAITQAQDAQMWSVKAATWRT
jgi:hypothetical protein